MTSKLLRRDHYTTLTVLVSELNSIERKLHLCEEGDLHSILAKKYLGWFSGDRSTAPSLLKRALYRGDHRAVQKDIINTKLVRSDYYLVDIHIKRIYFNTML